MLKKLSKLKVYYFTAIFSVIFAIVGFSYNTWRLEVSEDNANIRTASFKVLESLAELEQNIYAAHYDNNHTIGSPRNGWIKIGLVADLTLLLSSDTQLQAKNLQEYWSGNWQNVPNDVSVVNELVKRIDHVKISIKRQLIALN